MDENDYKRQPDHICQEVRQPGDEMFSQRAKIAIDHCIDGNKSQVCKNNHGLAGAQCIAEKKIQDTNARARGVPIPTPGVLE